MTRPPSRPRLLKSALAIPALTLILAACSSDSSSDEAAPDEAAVTTAVEVAETSAVESAPPTTSGEIDDDTIDVLAEFPVEGDTLVGEAPEDQQAVWDRFNELFPAATHPEVNLFAPIDAEASDGTDGAMQVSAVDDSMYYLSLDTTGSVGPDELDRTMIHEFNHLMALRPSQFPRDTTAEGCETYVSDGWCGVDDAYLVAYVDEFWPGATDEGFADEGPDAAEERFNDDEFVTEYAATNPGEDLAEVFAEWVIRDEAPTGDAVVDQKLEFWDDYPEAVALRENVRVALGKS